MHKLPIITIPLVLSFLGLIFLTLSSQTEANSTTGDPFYFAVRQSLWLAIGLVCYFIFSRLNSAKIIKKSPFLYFFCLFLLILVLIPQYGTKTLGARRWLNIFGLQGIQPSEVIKLISVIYFPMIFSQKENLTLKNLISRLLPPVVLILFEPNLSTAILLCLIAISVYYLAGSDIVPLFSFCLAIIAVGIGLTLLSPYRLARFKALVSTEKNSQISYHNHQILLSLSSGGVFGKGFANSDQKYKFIPKISTDSIIAIIGEETGFIGLTLIIFLYLILILHLFKLSAVTPNPCYSLTVSAIACWISFQTIINLSAIVAILPLTGIPLPFISYGGSSLVSIYIALGIASSIKKEHPQLIYSNHDRQTAKNRNNYRHPPYSRSRTD